MISRKSASASSELSLLFLNHNRCSSTHSAKRTTLKKNNNNNNHFVLSRCFSFVSSSSSSSSYTSTTSQQPRYLHLHHHDYYSTSSSLSLFNHTQPKIHSPLPLPFSSSHSYATYSSTSTLNNPSSSSSSLSNSNSSSSSSSSSSMQNQTPSSTPVSLETALHEGLQLLGFKDTPLDSIALTDLQIKAKLLTHIMRRSNYSFTSLGISAIHKASDILDQASLNHHEKVTLFPVSDAFIRESQQPVWPPNLKFIPYDQKLRKKNRQWY